MNDLLQPSDLLLASAPPAVTVAEAETIARVHFDIDAVAQRLSSERDTNFQLLTRDGLAFVLKFANAAEPAAHINFQTEALLHIERTDPTLPVPRVFRNTAGLEETPLLLSDGRPCVARVLTWLDGVQMYRLPIPAALRRDTGRTLARLGRALADFDHPASDRDLLWDIKTATRLSSMTAAITDPAMRGAVIAHLDRFDREFAPVLPALRSQVVHNDLNHHNVVINPARPEMVGGVLDFGDMVKTPLIIDVAVGASYMTALADDAVQCVCDFVGAYHQVQPLTVQELAILPHLIVTRLVTTITITSWRAARYPENADYILRNNGPARQGMARLAAIPADGLRRHLMTSCGLE